MSATTEIQWTDATWIVDRGGRRVRKYQRLDPTRPGQQERRRKRAEGLAWCRGCREWLALEQVRDGVCREHRNAEYRAGYAADGRAVRARVRARKTGLDPLPIEGAEALLELFDGQCAYCPAVATTWDHVVPVVRSGRTEPGNVVPACRPCNSSKREAGVWEWLIRTGRIPSATLLDLLMLVEVA